MPDNDWDPSVKALLYFPDVLKFMNDNPDWTQTLGYAVTYQQQDVLKAVQLFRIQAYNAGNLHTNKYYRVVYSNNYIQILPSQPNMYYVPI